MTIGKVRQQKILGEKGSILLGNKRLGAFRLNEQVQVYLAVPDDRPLKDTVHAEDGRLGRVDDGSPEQGTEHATVTEMSVSQS